MSVSIARCVCYLVLACCGAAVYHAEEGWPRYVMAGFCLIEIGIASFLLRGIGLWEREEQSEHAHDLRLMKLTTQRKSDAKKPLRAQVRY